MSEDWQNQTCDNCAFFTRIPGAKKVIITDKIPMHECRKNPPTLLVIPQATPTQGLVFSVAPKYPMLPEKFPACSWFQLRESGWDSGGDY